MDYSQTPQETYEELSDLKKQMESGSRLRLVESENMINYAVVQFRLELLGLLSNRYEGDNLVAEYAFWSKRLGLEE